MVPAIPLARWAAMRHLMMAAGQTAAGVIAAPAEMEAEEASNSIVK
jgi:hypothetical protein